MRRRPAWLIAKIRRVAERKQTAVDLACLAVDEDTPQSVRDSAAVLLVWLAKRKGFNR